MGEIARPLRQFIGGFWSRVLSFRVGWGWGLAYKLLLFWKVRLSWSSSQGAPRVPDVGRLGLVPLNPNCLIGQQCLPNRKSKAPLL